MLTRLLTIPLKEVTFAHRAFRAPREDVRARLERVGQAFLEGYHAALDGGTRESVKAGLELVELEFRGFAFEGAAMALDLLDQLRPWRTPALPSFLNGCGRAHVYMVHVGVGWSLARLPWRIGARLARLDPLLRWLALDGYGFHEGYFHWAQYKDPASRPKRLGGYALRAFDQGLGRSLWFVGGADPEWIAATIARFPKTRQADLWSGVGLACAYAGGGGVEEISRLRADSGAYHPHLAQGAAFAAGARAQAGNPARHTELACQLLCGLSAARAASLSEETRRQARDDSEPAYEVWRGLIRMRVAGQPRLSAPPRQEPDKKEEICTPIASTT